MKIITEPLKILSEFGIVVAIMNTHELIENLQSFNVLRKLEV